MKEISKYILQNLLSFIKELRGEPVAKFILFFALIFASCERDIDLKLPDAEAKIVIEGHIEPGTPPIVIVTKSQGYFDSTDVNAYENLFVRDAVVTVSDGTNTVTLDQICTQSIDTNLLPVAAELLGISTEDLKKINYCVYTTFNNSVWGKLHTTYALKVTADGKEYTASSTLHNEFYLDSIWWEPYKDGDSIGFMWATMSEPAGGGDAYRWYAKRLGKDDAFYAPLGSAYDDRFIDGKTFKFNAARGSSPNSPAVDDNNRERGFFKRGDKVIVKFCTIGVPERNFLRAYETEIGNNGNPFAAPTTIPTNISGGALGAWIAYTPTYDTVVCKNP